MDELPEDAGPEPVIIRMEIPVMRDTELQAMVAIVRVLEHLEITQSQAERIVKWLAMRYG